MAQLMTTDTGNSRAPDADRHARMATGAVAVLAGPAPGPDEIKDLLAERLSLHFPPGFDPAPHVQRVALPVPGDDSELFRAIAHAVERPLDSDRPQWECWIIEGLQDDQWAILIKIGHGLAEDPAPAQLLARLCDHADSGAFTNPAAADRVSPADAPGWADTVWQAAARAFNGLASAGGTLRRWPAGGSRPTMRRYRTVVVPRGPVDHIARKFGVSADDVAFAAITEGFRTVLLQRGERPHAEALRTVGTALTHLPVDQQDPIQQLRAVRNQVRMSRRPAGNSPFALCAKAIDAMTRLPQHDVMTLACAPPGPRYRLRLMGRRLERLLPIPPTAPDQGTGVAVVSYGNEMVFGITTDYDAAADVLAAGIESGMTRLVALSRDSVVLFDRRRKRPTRALPSGAARWRPSPPPARVRH